MAEVYGKIVNNRWAVAALCLFASFFAYYPTLDAKLVWDDSIVQIVQVPRIQSVSDAFFPPKGIPQWANTYYRPVVALTYYAEFAANARLNGSPHNPRWAMLLHFDTMIFHGLCAALVSLLAFSLLAGRPRAGLAALLCGLAFAVHPVHTESVAFVSGRSDSLATLFLVLSLIFALKRERGGGARFAFAAAGAFLLALLSKEVAASGLVIIFVLKWLAGQKIGDARKPSFWLAPGLMGAAFALYFALRLTANVVITGAHAFAPLENAWNLLAALGFYTLESFYPLNLSPYLPDFPGTLPTLAGLALLATLFGLALWAYRRGERLYVFCLLWFLATLAPSLMVVFYDFSETRLAERYLYLPSFAFALALGALVAGVDDSRKRRAATLGAGALFALYAATAFFSARDWGDEVTLWKTVLKDPNAASHSLPWTNLAGQYKKLGMDDKAEESYLAALKAANIDMDGRALTESGLGQIYFLRARSAFERESRSESLEWLLKSEAHYADAVNTGYPDWTIARDSARTRLLLAKLNRAMGGTDDQGRIKMLTRELGRAAALNPGNPEIRDLQAQLSAFLSAQQK